ncbi:MAG TPA: EAL domain-containing protein [Sideroxyarcus sp.]|nr:EAL domain-containing protein [Sideroxyarcus sp.]
MAYYRSHTGMGAVRMRSGNLFRMVRSYLTAVAVIATAAALVFAIYFTEASLQWSAFLTGVLVAAVLAEAVRVSRSEWIVMRRTAQLSALKDKLERESVLRRRAEEKIAADKAHLQLLDEKLQTMVALIDAKGICRYHNHAFREWASLRPELIDGRHIREILGATVYAEIATAIRQSLDGHDIRYERMQHMASGAVYRLAVEHVPQFDDSGKVTGFYILADDITARADLSPSGTVQPGVPDAAAAARNIADQQLFIDSFSEQVTGQRDAGNRIIAAIQRGEFRLYCQLISPLRADSGETEHYEILVRLAEEEEGMMPPGAFFPLAEKHGLMPYLDRWVVQHVLEWASGNAQQLRQADSVFFINVAAATIGDPEFPDFLRATLEAFGMQASLLCFEVPDTELYVRGASVAEFVRRVRECGCRVALSGFGRDAVSFDLIRGFQVEFLKIDGSLILNMLRDPVGLAKVVSIDQVAKKIGVRTVAELVESEALIAKLREVGVDYGQGFGISRPRALEE